MSTVVMWKVLEHAEAQQLIPLLFKRASDLSY